ncbi:LCP family protein [Priestia flexa]|uniref:LCP family protein n=1 Tax=Priestia flexa TaxID=86664 RepID=UPI001B331D19|nr:LCP family protein [Priestia flexa]
MKLKYTLLSLLIFLGCVLTGVIYVFSEKKVEAKEFNMLVMGVDEREADTGRSDVLMVVHFNSENGHLKMMPIPRDTRVKIKGKAEMEKINHAYKYGGIKLTVDTVEQFLNMPIDYYVKVNMEGFKAVVDEVGGVTVNNPFPFTFASYLFPQGETNLNGEKALAYVRMRHEDPKGDLGRNERQKQVVEALLDKGMSMSTVANLPNLLNITKQYVDTNVTIKDALAVYNAMEKGKPTFETVHVEGETQIVDGTWYYIVKDQEKQHIKAMLYGDNAPEEH